MGAVSQLDKLKNKNGFTLLELIIAVAVFGILAAIAIPLLNSTTKNADLRSAAQEMYGQFQRAKMEAIKRNQPVAIVFDTTGVDQYQVFVDLNNDKVLDAGEELLAEVVMPNGIDLPSITFPTVNKTGFTVKGRPSGGAGTVTINNAATSKSLTLTTSISGYVHLQ